MGIIPLKNPFGFDSMRASTFLTSRQYVRGFISEKKTFPPQYLIQLAEAANVIGDVITLVFASTFSARADKCNAAVPLLTAKANLEPIYLAKSFSNSAIFGPCVRKSDCSVSTTALISLSVM